MPVTSQTVLDVSGVKIAHRIYGAVGFTPLPKPERWMTFLPETPGE